MYHCFLDSCQTPSGSEGSCVSLRACPNLLRLLRSFTACYQCALNVQPKLRPKAYVSHNSGGQYHFKHEPCFVPQSAGKDKISMKNVFNVKIILFFFLIVICLCSKVWSTVAVCLLSHLKKHNNNNDNNTKTSPSDFPAG